MNAKEAEAYNRVALGPNAPMYAYYAERILASTGIVCGTCLDVGCGGGYLGLALAAISSLEFIFLDPSAAMIRHAEQNIADRRIGHRARSLQGKVQEIPLPDGAIDLVISRGSVPFWTDLPLAFQEIHRVLRPGGKAYVGGGLGPKALRLRTEQAIQGVAPEWFGKPMPHTHRDTREYEVALASAGIKGFSVTRGDIGTWIEFTRE